ncbi:serine protease [Alkalihalophilus pseudofirmus]|nr:serine protease [Alkalihalophilus pseudofirmus]
MFGYSMVQMVRAHAHKLDKPLREKVLNQYKPFKWTPCFLHKLFEGIIKRTKKLSVIIEFQKGCYEEGCYQVEQIFKSHSGCKIRNEFTSVSCCSAEMTPNALEKVLSSCNHVRKIYLNREVQALLDTAVVASNARNVVRNGTTLTGKGVTVAVIDTGVHPHQDLSARIVDFVDFINQRTDPYDDNGHGTHCAGDALGDGSASSGRYQGPAPEANLVGVKVLNKMGSGSLETVMQGVEYCIQYNERNPEHKINIINMSLGAPALRYEDESDDPMVRIVNQAWEAGIVVCVAAGNSGPEYETIASPGISEKVITVGALDDRDTVERDDDDVASFSSRGPTIYGKDKPDIVAPGVNIVSLRSPKSFIDKLQKGNRVGSDYIILSGTSMATPICAGIVALMLEHNPALTPNQVKNMLKEGTDLWNDPEIYDIYKYGSGYINADNSIPH